MEDDTLKDVRERFFEGEGPVNAPVSRTNRSHRKILTPDDMMCRIDPRLRQVVVKACANSYPASKVVGKFEDFIVASFAADEMFEDFVVTSADGTKGIQLPEDWWSGLLLDHPTITKDDSPSEERTIANFFFDAESSTGGFHRLLLHAVAQFHGLKAVSKITRIGASKARTLVVSGSMDKVKFRLLDYLAEKERA
jgi:hypothetical protein